MSNEIMINKISNEPYNNLEQYINGTIPYISKIEDPYFITLNNKKYFTTGNDEAIVMSTVNNNKINAYSISLDNDDVKQVIKDNDIYYLMHTPSFSYVVKTNKDYSYSKQLQIEKYEEDKTAFLYFTQHDINNNVVQFTYDLSGINDDLIEQHLTYMSGRRPDSISCKKLFLNTFYINAGNDIYHPSLKLFNNYFVDARREYKLYNIIKYGKFLNSVPKELLTLLANTNREYNEVKIVSDVYKKVRKM